VTPLWQSAGVLEWSLRPATLADVPFLRDVVIAATRDQGRLPAGFDEPAWGAGFTARSAEQITAGPGTFVIESDGGPVGRLRLVDSPDCLEVAGLQLLPSAQSRGIGTAVLLRLAADAAPRPLTLGVEKDNPRARALYERLGFAPDGETETEYRLRRTAGWQGEVRQARLGDADDVARLAAELAMSFEFSAARFRENYPALLAADGACLLLAVSGREIIAYLLGFRHLTFYANGPVGWVEEVVVRDQDRGQGIGRVLMDAFEQWAAAQGCALVALATRRAAPFYLALGYEESATYFRKVLDAAPAGETGDEVPPSPSVT
jgi:GNAT superfamily N-acetyltransferase